MSRVLTQWMDEPEDFVPADELQGFEIVPDAVEVETVERRDSDRWTALGDATLRWIDAEGAEQSVEVQMVDRSPDGLKVVSPREFTVGKELFLSLPQGTEQKAVVRHHEESQGGWYVGLRVIHHERRRFERFPVEGAAHLHWGDSKHGHRTLPVEVKNIACEGMQLRVMEEIPPGTVVKIRGDAVQCVGVTWYSRPDGEAFLVGVQMTRKPHNPNGLDFPE